MTRIEFVLDEGERANWRDHVMPKLARCRGVSFILGDREADGQAAYRLAQ